MKKMLLLLSVFAVVAGTSAFAQSSCDIVLVSPLTVSPVAGSPGMWTFSISFKSVTSGKKSLEVKSADGFSKILNTSDNKDVVITYTSDPFAWPTKPNLYWVAYTAPDGGGAVCAQQVLATNFSAFTARKDGAGAVLSVTIASDNFSQPLTVYRSSDGVTFKKIGEISIVSTKTTYTYKDAWPEGNKAYYKLGAEGGRYFTSIALVTLDNTFGYILQTKMLKVPAGTDVAVYNNAGQALIMTSNTELISLSNLPTGVYRFTMIDPQTKQTCSRGFYIP